MVGEALFRYEAFYRLTNLRFAAGIDARMDSHQQTGDATGTASGGIVPAAVRCLPSADSSATYTRGRLTVEAGKQLIRWGRADVLTPTTGSRRAIS